MTDATDMSEVVAALAYARDGWPEDGRPYPTDGVAFAAWNKLLDADASLNDEGRAFLAKFGPMYPGLYPTVGEP